MSDFKHNILEIRYKANPLIIDNRGLLLKLLVAAFKLEDIAISEVGVTLKKPDKSVSMFVLHDRLGVNTSEAVSEADFREMSHKFLQLVFSLEIFSKEIFITRVGIRKRVCDKFEGSFDVLLSLFQKNYVSIPDRLLAALNLKLTDIGFPIIYEDETFTVNTNCGPMISKQIMEYFNDHDYVNSPAPPVGYYIDVDYYKNCNENMTLDAICEMLNKYMPVVNEKVNVIRKQVMGE